MDRECSRASGGALPTYLYGRQIYGGLTQLGACFPYKEKVGGSSPSSSTKTHTAIYKLDWKSR